MEDCMLTKNQWILQDEDAIIEYARVSALLDCQEKPFEGSRQECCEANANDLN